MTVGRTGPPTAPARLTVAVRTDTRLVYAGERVAALLGAATDDGYPAGATFAIVDADGELITTFAGSACLVGTEIPTAYTTHYDLASLTKVVCTVPLVMVLAERRQWDLDDPVSRWLDGFPNTGITLRQLLTHTSGLPAHREFYRLAGGADAIRAAVYGEASAARGPAEVCYSDLGFMLLGWALESCAGMPLDQLFATTIAEPLGMQATCFRPPAQDRPLTAATELDGDQRLQPGLVWGEVHDGNAWALGGVAGHAGLFGPTGDLVKYASALLAPEDHPVLQAASIAEMTRRQAGGPPDLRALGWRLDARDWGPWPPRTHWHTGFTGTSLLIAPELGIAVVLLMGGVHPSRRPEQQLALRATVHREILAALT